MRIGEDLPEAEQVFRSPIIKLDRLVSDDQTGADRAGFAISEQSDGALRLVN